MKRWAEGSAVSDPDMGGEKENSGRRKLWQSWRLNMGKIWDFIGISSWAIFFSGGEAREAQNATEPCKRAGYATKFREAPIVLGGYAPRLDRSTMYLETVFYIILLWFKLLVT